jgi:hypothetical protein
MHALARQQCGLSGFKQQDLLLLLLLLSLLNVCLLPLPSVKVGSFTHLFVVG